MDSDLSLEGAAAASSTDHGLSGIHSIHDYCSRLNPCPQSSDELAASFNPSHTDVQQIVMSDVEAEEVFLEEMTDGHLPSVLKIKKEIADENDQCNSGQTEVENYKEDRGDLQSSTPLSGLKGIRLWTDDNIKLLLDCRLECNKLFGEGATDKKPWVTIRNKMIERNPTFNGSIAEISGKFRNLKTTYRHNKQMLQESKGATPISWPWFQAMHRIVGRDEFPFVRVRVVQQSRLSDNQLSSPRLINGWTMDEIKLLLSVCEDYSVELRRSPRKLRMWKKMQLRMSDLKRGFSKPYMKVYSQWKYLVREYLAFKRSRKRDHDSDGNVVPSSVPPWYYPMESLVGSWKNLNEWVDDVDNDQTTPSNDLILCDSSGEHRLHERPSILNQDTCTNEWSSEDIKSLIRCRLQCEDMFLNPELSFLDSWSHVRDMMCSQNITAVACADKWLSLISTYHEVDSKRRSNVGTCDENWEWYDTLHNALFGQKSSDKENDKDNDGSNVTLKTNDNSIVSATPKTGVYRLQKIYDVFTRASNLPPGSSNSIWNNKTIEMLLKARSQQSSNQTRKRGFWKNVLKSMIEIDPEFYCLTEQLSTKWRHMTLMYQQCRQRVQASGRDSVTWEWYDSMDAINHTFNDSTLTDFETGEAASQMESDDEEQGNKSKCWSSEHIKLLLTTREEFSCLFSGQRGRSHAWKAVCSRMTAVSPSFQGTFVECSDKFRNLLSTYKANKSRLRVCGRENVCVNWPWFEDMDRIMKRLKTQRPGLVTLAGLSDIEDSTNQQFTEYEVLANSDEDETDAGAGKSELWSSKNIRLLIESREECRQFFVRDSKTACAWKQVRDRMVAKEPLFPGTADQCSRKWRNLCFTYRAVKRRQKDGEEPLWPWFKLINKFYSLLENDRRMFDLALSQTEEDVLCKQPSEELQTEPPAKSQQDRQNTSTILDSDTREWRGWLTNFLIRMEEREKRCEEREERMLAIMEQMLALEKGKANSTAVELTSLDDEDISQENQDDIVSYVEVASGPVVSTTSPILHSPLRVEEIGPKTRLSQLLDTRASVIEEVRNYSELEFKNRFRISRDVFKILKQGIVYAEMAGGRPRLSKDLSMYISLWLLGNANENFRSTARRFGINESSCHRIHKIMVKKIAALHTKYIKWPLGDELKAVMSGFSNLRGANSFPGVIGCLDGTHITIRKQITDSRYMNTSKHHSVILQAVCDHRGVFMDVCAGWPGSMHDSSVWQSSPIFSALEADRETIPSDCHLLADCAYPLSPYLMKPYSDEGALTPMQLHYNATLSSTWEVIEGAFALLKARCTCLKKIVESVDLDFIKDVIMACCVLHNLCLLRDDDSKYDIIMDTTIELDSGTNHYDCTEVTDIEAELKRSSLAELIWRRDTTH